MDESEWELVNIDHQNKEQKPKPSFKHHHHEETKNVIEIPPKGEKVSYRPKMTIEEAKVCQKLER